VSRRADDIGKVWLVGAGPGDPELLTLRAARLLARADVVAYDELVPPEILALVRPDAELLAVGRRADARAAPRTVLDPRVLDRAREGRCVVRLKGGDPLVFGRAGEELELIVAAGIPVEIVPGVTSGLAAAAAVGIPLTHRDSSSSITIATAHPRADGALVLGNLPRGGTLVLYMGLGRVEAIVESLTVAGWDPATPAAVVSQASLPGERAVFAPLSGLADAVRDAALPTPAIIVVGAVVAERRIGSSTRRVERDEAAEQLGEAGAHDRPLRAPLPT
jgi:uroporphyrin-III C-methyltransferase